MNRKKITTSKQTQIMAVAIIATSVIGSSHDSWHQQWPKPTESNSARSLPPWNKQTTATETSNEYKTALAT